MPSWKASSPFPGETSDLVADETMTDATAAGAHTYSFRTRDHQRVFESDCVLLLGGDASTRKAGYRCNAVSEGKGDSTWETVF